MKKTISVNLNGSIFVLDEDAYQVLDNYLKQLNRHFANEEGKQEIIADIEARIAEHLKSGIKIENQIINLEEINRIIEIMGKPGDLGDEKPQSESSRTYHNYKKMYRDIDDKMLGGVCSGMGHYWKVEPALFRIIFLLSIFFFVGTSILVYIILWIVIPPALTTAQKLEMRGEPVTAENIGKSFDNKKN
ncbi:MAG: PspC domain-containing protein [Bacteroidales bacterium]